MSQRAEKRFSGEEKTAILMVALGPEGSAPLMKQLDDATLVRVSRRMAELGKIDPERLNEVMTEYLGIHESDDMMLQGTHKDVVSLFHRAIEEDRAERILNEMSKPRTLTIWEKLSRLSPYMIKSYIEEEHPQTIALILGNVDTTLASQVIALLPEDMQMSFVMRMSKIESVPAELVKDIEETLEKEMSESTGSSGMSFDGMISVVDILKTLDKSVSKPLLQRLEQRDQDLFQQVDKLLLVFEDLMQVSDRDIQTVLKHISSDDLVRSLKGAPDELAESFFRNMSSRAAEIMREDMQVMGPLKLADVEEAQQNILKVVRKLDEDGSISLTSSDDMV